MVSNTVPPPSFTLALPPPAPARGHMEAPDEILLEAMREVDAMLPPPPPIAPPVRLRPGVSAGPNGHPRCVGPGGCGHYHRRGIPCGQALNERHAAPPPLPTPDVDLFEKIQK